MAPPPRQLAALCALADRLAPTGARWLLAGSAARAVRGCPVRPADIDVELEPAGAQRAAAALGVRLSEDRRGSGSSWRASLRIAGVAVDVTCGLVIRGPAGGLPADFERWWERSHPLSVCGRPLRAMPLEEVLCRAIVAADWGRLTRIAAQAAGADPPLRLDGDYVAERLSFASWSAAR